MIWELPSGLPIKGSAVTWVTVAALVRSLLYAAGMAQKKKWCYDKHLVYKALSVFWMPCVEPQGHKTCSSWSLLSVKPLTELHPISQIYECEPHYISSGTEFSHYLKKHKKQKNPTASAIIKKKERVDWIPLITERWSFVYFLTGLLPLVIVSWRPCSEEAWHLLHAGP